MKRLLALFAVASAFGFSACEPHPKSDLPKEFQERGEAKKDAAAPAEKPAGEAAKH